MAFVVNGTLQASLERYIRSCLRTLIPERWTFPRHEIVITLRCLSTALRLVQDVFRTVVRQR